MLNFIGIGAQKAGTTWLYEQLSKHPKVGFPGGKEVHYWDARLRQLPEVWYSDLFNTPDGKVNGDITPAYSTLDLDVIRRIPGVVGRPSIIFILRNPIERAWSSALMALQRAELEVDEVSDQWFLDHFFSRGSRLRGDYERTLRLWSDVFGRNRILVPFYEEIVEQPLELLGRVSRFIGIDDSSAWDLQEVSRPVFQGAGGLIRPTLLAPLVEFYRPRIDSLSRYLDRDLSSWHRRFRA